MIQRLQTTWDVLRLISPFRATFFLLAALALSLTLMVRADVIESGFTDRTIWDGLDVLGVPLAVAVIAALFGWTARRAADERADVERGLNRDRAREATLRSYLDRMAALVLEQDLQDSDGGSAVRAVAHAETFAAIRDLDGPRKGILLEFLHESNLIKSGRTVISLARADLTNSDLSSLDLTSVNLAGAKLGRSDLYYANLSGAILTGADLSSADLYECDLKDAKLTDSILSDADLRGANPFGATVTHEQLAKAYSLVGAKMTDGTNMTEERWKELQGQF